MGYPKSLLLGLIALLLLSACTKEDKRCTTGKLQDQLLDIWEVTLEDGQDQRINGILYFKKNNLFEDLNDVFGPDDYTMRRYYLEWENGEQGIKLVYKNPNNGGATKTVYLRDIDHSCERIEGIYIMDGNKRKFWMVPEK